LITRGEGGVWRRPKSDHTILEQPLTDMEKYNFDKRYVMSEKGYVEFGEQFHSCPIEFEQHLALADMTIPIPQT
jgi:hypothetical protein